MEDMPIFVTVAGLLIGLVIIVRSRYEARAKVAHWELHLRPSGRTTHKAPGLEAPPPP